MGQDGNGLFVKNCRDWRIEPGIYRAFLYSKILLASILWVS
nr:MAG TPA: hypothetical protein [Caudoviricetes sp.]